jgi:hypothetical protein
MFSSVRVTDVSDELKMSLRDRAPLDNLVFVMRMAALELSANVRLRANMMGFERQGKTSFVRALFGEALPRDCDRTVGVELRHMSDVDRGVSSTGAKLPPCAVTLFDFGGHVEYYSLQRGFLVRDCVHVVTVNLADVASTDGDLRARALRGVRWWLEALSACDVGGVVALLGTHLDEVSPYHACVQACRSTIIPFVCDALQMSSLDRAEAAMREVFTTFTALQHELFDDGSMQQRRRKLLVGVVAAVSCAPSNQRCLYWRLDEGTSALPTSRVAEAGVLPVLRQLLLAASTHMTSFVDAPIPDRWEAALRVVQDERKHGVVFGEGAWMVPWRRFVARARDSLCLTDDGDAHMFARYLEKIGVVVALRGACDDKAWEGDGDGGVCDGDGDDAAHRWVVRICRDPELLAGVWLPSREIIMVQVARVQQGQGAGA